MLARLALSAVIFVLALLGAEVGHRLWLAHRGRPYDRRAAEDDVRQAMTPQSQLLATIGARRVGGPHGFERPLVFHPYAGAESAHDTWGVLEHFRSGTAEREYTIVVVGGSVAEQVSSTHAAVIAERVGHDPRFADRPIAVLDYAHWAYKQPQQLARVAYLLQLGYRPDAVINLDGANEVTGTIDNMRAWVHPVYPSYQLWGRLVMHPGTVDPVQTERIFALWRLRTSDRPLLRATLKRGLCASSLWARFVLDRVHAIDRERVRLQEEIMHHSLDLAPDPLSHMQSAGPAWVFEENAVFELSATAWFESSLTLDALCRARGIRYVHLLQPNLYVPESKPLTAAERALVPPGGGHGPSIRGGYPLLRAKGRELAAHGVDFVDLTQIFAAVTADLYYDEFHVGPAGKEMLAEALAAAFLAHLPAGDTQEH